VLFLGLTLVAMHAIQPGLSPATHYVSEYAHGQLGWLVMVGYLVAGAGVLGLAWSAGSILTGTRSLALAACLALVSVGLIGTGVTRIDLPETDGSVTSTASGMAHELAGYVAILGLIPGAFLAAGAFRRDPRLAPAALGAWVFAGAIVIASPKVAPTRASRTSRTPPTSASGRSTTTSSRRESCSRKPSLLRSSGTLASWPG